MKTGLIKTIKKGNNIVDFNKACLQPNVNEELHGITVKNNVNSTYNLQAHKEVQLLFHPSC